MSWSELFPSIWSWEFLGFITGIFSVLLLIPTKLVRLQWTNWIFSIVSATVYMYLFYEWTLYGNALLQPLFLAISIWGAWYWRGQLRGFVDSAKEVPITYASTATVLTAVLIALLGLIPVYPLLAHWGDASPLWDGLILTVSLSAVTLQLLKYVQNWYLWILVDIIAVPFHLSQERGATALLYLGYGLMCLFGWHTWRQTQREGGQP